MKRQLLSLGTFVAVGVALMLATAAPAHAQLGSLQGRVVDEAGQPVADATVTLEYKGELNLKFTTQTNATGQWVRAGLMAVGGRWMITATKGDLTGFAANVEVPLSSVANVPDIIVRPGGATPGGDVSAAEAEARNKEAAALRALLAEVNAALSASNYDVAITKLNEAAAKIPNCDECHVQLGEVFSRQKNFEQAEAAFKQAIELNPQSAAAYDGLAALYNTQGKLDLAAAASVKAGELHAATGGGDATSAYNTGAILVNSGKMAEAKAQFQRAIQLDPKMAEAHYQLAMTFINEGNVAEAIKSLEQYLALAPSGPNAQMAKDMLPELKKMQ